MHFKFHCPTQLRIGHGQLASLTEEVMKIGCRPLLVLDPNVASASAAVETAISNLTTASLTCQVFDQIEPNPRVETISAGAEVCRAHETDVIVAIGGGSTLDSAKAIAAVAVHGGSIWEYVGDDLVPGPITPLVTVPTTAGTGSETTPFAVFTRAESRRKDGIYSPFFFPQLSILDAEVYRTLPPRLSAETGMDALAHAIEGLTAQAKNPVCDSLALGAIRLIARSLRTAVHDGQDLAAREDMALASALAGMVITHCGVGAAHGIGMSIGGLYNVPHGRAIATLLPPVMHYNFSAVPERFAAIEQVLRDEIPEAAGLENAAEMITWLADQVGIPAKLASIGVQEAQLGEILADCMERQDMQNNAHTIDPVATEHLLRSIL